MARVFVKIYPGCPLATVISVFGTTFLACGIGMIFSIAEYGILPSIILIPLGILLSNVASRLAEKKMAKNKEEMEQLKSKWK